MDCSDEEFLYDENLEDDALYVNSGEDMQFVEIEDKVPQSYDADYEIFSAEKIASKMDECISEVSSVINMPKTVTRILLNHFNWDREKLMEKYYDEDQAKLFAEAHVVSPFEVDNKSTTGVSSGKKECQVCFTAVSSSTMAGLKCGHQFCKECWDQYLKIKVMSEGKAESITCPAYKCGILVDDDTVMSLLKSSSDKAKYQRLMMNSFVESNKFFRWCPSPGCNRVIKVKSFESKLLIKCQCNHTFCFSCGESWHEPINCAHLRKWIKKCNDDSETMNWVSANTKNCTMCEAVIEKNGGCNHMTCIKCLYEFCWICEGNWKKHDKNYEQCNQFNEAKQKSVQGSRQALERYLFYCTRYVNHQNSLKLEDQLYQSMEAMMDELIHKHKLSWIDVRYLKDAVDILHYSRQTLSYTYIFAYFVERNNQVIIFEDNQNDLNRAVESLSEYLEKNIAKEEDILDIKMKISDLCRYCEDRRKILLEHVHEGNEKGWWRFN